MQIFRIVLPLILAATALSVTSPAGAQDDDGSCPRRLCSGGGQSGGGSIGAEAVQFGSGNTTPVVVPGAPAWLAPCGWAQTDFVTTYFEQFGIEPGPEDLVGTEDDMFWIVSCPASSISEAGFGDVATGILEVFPVGDPPPQRVIDVLIRDAYESTPVMSFYPSTAPWGTLEAPLITRFPTMLWVDEADWVPVTATASIPPLSVTVTATPVETLWSGGHDPETIACDGGVEVNLNIDYDDNDLDCSMLYFHTTNVGDWTLELVATWEAAYVCTEFCGAGPLPDLVTESIRDVRVAEIQVLLVPNSRGNG